jgi:hypothetical protein
MMAFFHSLFLLRNIVQVACLLAVFCAFVAPAAAYDVNDRPPTFSNMGEEEEAEEEEEEPLPQLLRLYKQEGKNTAFEDICDQGYFTESVVNCVTGVIDEAVVLFFEEFSLLLNSYILSLIVLAVVLFGGKILIGTVEKPGPDAFMLLLKIAAVLFFTQGLGGFTEHIFGIMASLAGYAMSYLSQGVGSGFATGCGTDAVGDISIWVRVDCIIGNLFMGVPSRSADSDSGVLTILVMAIFWTNVFGVLVAIVMFVSMVMVLLLLLRCVFVFLASYAMLSLLIIISPLIIPLVLFQNTQQFFVKWWKQFLSMLVQPMIVFAFLAFTMALLDALFFKDEEYSLAAVLGMNWTTPVYSEGYTPADLEEVLANYRENTGFSEEDEEYKNYVKYLAEKRDVIGVGNVAIESEPLVTIELLSEDQMEALHDIPVVGKIIGGVATLGTDILNNVVQTLIPFYVPRISPEGRSAAQVLFELMRFFLVLLILLPLLKKFAEDIPGLMQRLSSAIRIQGMILPGERQLHGTVGAVKGVAKGAVKGAVSGALVGGKKGAIAGAVEGAARGGVSGYQQGVAKLENGGGSAAMGGEGGSGGVHGQQSQGTDRKVLFGGGEGGGGKVGAAVKELAIAAATKKAPVGKGGGIGAGKAAGATAGKAGRATQVARKGVK